MSPQPTPAAAPPGACPPAGRHGTGGRAILKDQNPEPRADSQKTALPDSRSQREHHIKGGFPADVDEALRHIPGLLQAVASRVLGTYFPATLHADIVATLGLDLDGASELRDSAPAPTDYTTVERRRRDPGFRERVLRAYEYRCCVCGFDLRIGHTPAGLEAAHIQWHHVGGPDIEPNGLSLCALHHKLFDLGVFTVEPAEHRVVFSQHAISGGRGMEGELQFHGRAIHAPQHADLLPAAEFLAWNTKNVFKTPARQVGLADATPSAAR